MLCCRGRKEPPVGGDGSGEGGLSFASAIGKAGTEVDVDEDDAAGTSVATACVASEEPGTDVAGNAAEGDTDGAVAAAAAVAGAGEVSSFCGVPDLARLCGDDTDAATELGLLLLPPAADLEGVSALNASISCAAEAWRPCGSARCGGGVPPVLAEGNVKAAFEGETLAGPVTGIGEGVAEDGTIAAAADANTAGSDEADWSIGERVREWAARCCSCCC